MQQSMAAMLGLSIITLWQVLWYQEWLKMMLLTMGLRNESLPQKWEMVLALGALPEVVWWSL